MSAETLDALLDRATTPIPGPPDADTILKICAKIRRLSEGPSDATIVLLEKARHKNVVVALKAIQVLDAVVKNCGPPTHNIVGKFRFLNEFIKMVSPKYFTNTPPEVQQKILALLQRWNFNLPGQPKIHEAYQMLKSQGIVFPTVVPTDYLNVPCGEGFLDVAAESFSERKSPLEQDENKSKMLAKLLQSKDPNDLARANKLIKKLVVEDEKRTERDIKLRGDLELVKNNVRVLGDMLANFNPSVDGRLEQNDIIQELYTACTQMRPKLFTLAGELNDRDPLFGEVLAHNDELTKVLDQYNRVKATQPATGIAGPPAPAPVSAPPPSVRVTSTPTSTHAAAATAARPAADGDCSLIDFDLAPPRAAPISTAAQLEREFVGLDLGPLKASAPSQQANFASFPGGASQQYQSQQQQQQHYQQQQQHHQQQQQQQQQQQSYFQASFPSAPAAAAAPAAASNRLPDLFGGPAVPTLPMPGIPGLLSSNTPYGAPSTHAPASALAPGFGGAFGAAAPAPTAAHSAGLLVPNLLSSPASGPSTASASLLAPSLLSSTPSFPSAAPAAVAASPLAAAADTVDLSSLTVTVDAVRPTEHAPITAYDKNNLRVLLHICRAATVPSNVIVVLASFANSGTLPITRVNFQAAVPKTLQIKLLPPSGTDLPPFNPIQPPTALTQIMLLGNPSKAPLRLRFKLTFVVSGQEISDQGDVSTFPAL